MPSRLTSTICGVSPVSKRTGRTTVLMVSHDLEEPESPCRVVDLRGDVAIPALLQDGAAETRAAHDCGLEERGGITLGNAHAFQGASQH